MTLSDEQVRDLRYRYKYQLGAHLPRLAQDVNLDEEEVAALLRGETRPEAGGPIAKKLLDRSLYGEKSHGANGKLTTDLVREIRERYRSGEGTGAQLAEHYGIDEATVSRIVTGKTWPEAGGPIKGRDYRSPQNAINKRRIFTPTEVQAIRKRYYRDDSLSQNSLARQLDVAVRTVRKLLDGDTYADAGGPIKGDDYRVTRSGERIPT